MVIHLTEAMATILAGGTGGSGTEMDSDTEIYCSNQIREAGKKKQYRYYCTYIYILYIYIILLYYIHTHELILQIVRFPAYLVAFQVIMATSLLTWR